MCTIVRTLPHPHTATPSPSENPPGSSRSTKSQPTAPQDTDTTAQTRAARRSPPVNRPKPKPMAGPRWGVPGTTHTPIAPIRGPPAAAPTPLPAQQISPETPVAKDRENRLEPTVKVSVLTQGHHQAKTRQPCQDLDPFLPALPAGQNRQPQHPHPEIEETSIAVRPSDKPPPKRGCSETVAQTGWPIPTPASPMPRPHTAGPGVNAKVDQQRETVAPRSTPPPKTGRSQTEPSPPPTLSALPPRSKGSRRVAPAKAPPPPAT